MARIIKFTEKYREEEKMSEFETSGFKTHFVEPVKIRVK